MKITTKVTKMAVMPSTIIGFVSRCQIYCATGGALVDTERARKMPASILCPNCGDEIDVDPDVTVDFYAEEDCEQCQEDAEGENEDSGVEE